jgi:hypothetical protein
MAGNLIVKIVKDPSQLRSLSILVGVVEELPDPPPPFAAGGFVELSGRPPAKPVGIDGAWDVANPAAILVKSIPAIILRILIL